MGLQNCFEKSDGMGESIINIGKNSQTIVVEIVFSKLQVYSLAFAKDSMQRIDASKSVYDDMNKLKQLVQNVFMIPYMGLSAASSKRPASKKWR